MPTLLARCSLWFLFLLLIVCVPIVFYVYTPFIYNKTNLSPRQTDNLDQTIAVVASYDIQSESIALTANAKVVNHVLYVISLDGRITAIDIRQDGRQLWTADTGSPLINSTISQIELSHNSKLIRVIPSLLGGLFGVYDGHEHLEPLPFDAESLLNTSFQSHDELVMTGGKDVDLIGIDLQTGKVVYSSAKNDVHYSASESTCSASTMVVKRVRRIVRARCARTGFEKWNFSVSKHELIYYYVPKDHVEETNNYHQHSIHFEYQLQSGIVLAFSDDRNLIWTSSINSPIAAVWELKNGHLTERSLLRTRLANRLAFMGKFNSMPYVLISLHAQRQLIYHARQSSSSNTKRPTLSFWHSDAEKQDQTISYEVSTPDHNYPLATWHETTWDSIGYLELTSSSSSEYIINNEKFEVSIYSPSENNWLLILSSMCLCALIIILIRRSRPTLVPFSHQESMVSTSSNTTIDYQLFEPSFQSRYDLEYEHIRFLGRGGFGAVFEAINKLDQRRVAIKRVPLKKPSGKERALKEIRCLARLNHPNLIQYYYAWDECPPNGWQDDIDKRLTMHNSEATKDSLSLISLSTTSDHCKNQVSSGKPPDTTCDSSLIDFTFERSLNLHQTNDDSNSSMFEHSYEDSTEDDTKEVSIDQSKSLLVQTKTNYPVTYFYFVMELCQTETLRCRLTKQMITTQSEALSIFDQIIHGIEYIHSQKLIHCDLKPSNILFSMENTVKIGDFGLISAFGEDKNNETGGTRLYMSPEQISRQSYNQKVDIYAIGIILFELVYPFSTQMERLHTLEKIRQETPVFPADFQCNLIMSHLIRWLLAHSPHDRPKACELREDRSYQDMLKTENILY